MRKVRTRVAEQTDIPADHVLVSTSHTHSGPMTWVAEDPYDRFRPNEWKADEDWTRTLQAQLAGAVLAAWHTLRPARLAVGAGELHGLAYNRRRYLEGGKPVDPTIPVLLAVDEHDAPIAVLYSYTCHPVTLRENNLLISADYPGVASRLIEQTFPGVTALFANGCCGDQDPLHSFWGSFERTEQAGRMVGGEVIQVIARLTAQARFESDPSLAMAARRIPLPVMSLPDRAGAAELIQTQECFLAEVRERQTEAEGTLFPRNEPFHSMISERSPTEGMAQFYLSWARHIQSLVERDTPPPVSYAEIQAMRIGPLTIVGLPGEIFMELGARIKEALSPAPVLVCGYTNGNVGYVPTRAAYAEGGYEVVSAQRLRALPRAPEAGERMV
ncbi:MAG: neutral/alkaline non-lysosomal ceramidase N-terminal domain-containing protein, partial [Chloroflexota bacterium]